MRSPSQEYLYLFDTVDAAADTMLELQVWVAVHKGLVKNLIAQGRFLDALELLVRTTTKMETYLQKEQLILIEAMQSAEEIYISGED